VFLSSFGKRAFLEDHILQAIITVTDARIKELSFLEMLILAGSAKNRLCRATALKLPLRLPVLLVLLF
jgi:hypothetical protein